MGRRFLRLQVYNFFSVCTRLYTFFVKNPPGPALRFHSLPLCKPWKHDSTRTNPLAFSCAYPSIPYLVFTFCLFFYGIRPRPKRGASKFARYGRRCIHRIFKPLRLLGNCRAFCLNWHFSIQKTKATNETLCLWHDFLCFVCHFCLDYCVQTCRCHAGRAPHGQLAQLIHAGTKPALLCFGLTLYPQRRGLD